MVRISLPIHLGIWCLLASVAWGFNKRGFFSSAGCSLFGAGCESPEDKIKYGVLLDAGSSSTKLKVYRVTPAAEASALPDIDIAFSERFDPGLSDADDVRGYLTNIVDVAKANVPEAKQATTPIYLMATAGLRFLTAEDATALVDDVKDVFGDSSVSPFVFDPEKVGILSGEEEGVYAWVAANYLLEFFDGDKPLSDAVGVLEMGGGSTQITFVPVNPLYEGEYQVFVNGKPYNLYVHSYLQFGINAISLWVAQVLSEWNPQRRELENPCMLRDDVKNLTLEDGRTVVLEGSGDPVYCKEVLKHILSPETGIRCEPKPCAIGPVYQPSVGDIKFFATQGFTYAPNTLGVVGEDQVLHLDELEDAAAAHCDRTVKEAVDAGIKESVASTTCLMGLYIPTLFTLSYGFPPDTTNIKVTSNVGDDTIDWGLGAMVIELAGNSVKRRR